jgi:hypothetical protein
MKSYWASVNGWWASSLTLMSSNSFRMASSCSRRSMAGPAATFMSLRPRVVMRVMANMRA